MDYIKLKAFAPWRKPSTNEKQPTEQEDICKQYIQQGLSLQNRVTHTTQYQKTINPIMKSWEYNVQHEEYSQ